MEGPERESKGGAVCQAHSPEPPLVHFRCSGVFYLSMSLRHPPSVSGSSAFLGSSPPFSLISSQLWSEPTFIEVGHSGSICLGKRTSKGKNVLKPKSWKGS